MTSYTLPEQYLVIDPGKTTGWVEASIDHAYPGKPVLLRKCEDSDVDPTTIMEKFGNWQTRTRGDNRLVICEAFHSIPTEFYADANWSCQLIGCVRLLCALYRVPMIMQNPKARTQISNDTLQSSGYWRKGGKDDKREATKHLLAFLVAKRHMATVIKLYPKPVSLI